MAESKKKPEKDAQKLQSDLDKMKQVAKKLLSQNKSNKATIKKIEAQNKSSQQTIDDLQSKLEQSNTIQSQLEDAIEKKNTLITTLEQKITHKEEAEALQTTTTQQVLQELNQKCVDYEQQIATIKTEKEGVQQSNEELLKRIHELEQNHESTQPDEIASIKQKMADLLQEVDSKQSIIQTLQTENESLHKYKTEYEALQTAHSQLQNEIATLKQSVGNRQEIDEKDAERAKTLKSKMETMTSMMTTIQNGNQEKITELEEKLAVSLQRTEEMTREHEIQIKQYESSKQSLLSENKMANAKYEGLKDRVEEEEQRSASLMQLNEALKRSVMNLHQEKDELEDMMQEMQQKYIEFTQQNNTQSTPQNTANTTQNAKLLDLHSKTASFKESIRGLKEDMSSITTGFQQELMSSTQGFAAIHDKMRREKQKYVQNIERLTKEKEDIGTRCEELRKELEQLRVENEAIRHKNDECIASEQSHSSHGDKLMKELKNEREERKQLEILYKTLVTDCKEMERHLHEVESEYEAYKAESAQRKETLSNELNEKRREKEKVYEANVNKVLRQKEELKGEITQMADRHKAEMEAIHREKDELLTKYNDLCKLQEETHRELVAKKNEIEELLCNNQNMQDQIVEIKQNSGGTDRDTPDTGSVSPTKPAGIKRSQTPIEKGSKSLDFGAEIHKQLKDDNIAQRETIETLQNELNSMSEQYQKAVVEVQSHIQRNEELSSELRQLSKEKEAMSIKLTKSSQNMKLAISKAKQYKALSAKHEQGTKALKRKYDALRTEYETLDQRLVDKVKELQQKVSDNTKGAEQKYNEMVSANEALTQKLKQLNDEYTALQQKLETHEALKLKLKQMNDANTKQEERYNALQQEYNELNDVKSKQEERYNALQQKIQTHEALELKLNDRYNALQQEYNKNEEELRNKQMKLKQLTEDHASSAQQSQILQMEHKQMKEKTQRKEEELKSVRAQHKEDIVKTKSKYKAYITKQKKEAHAVNDKLETLQQKYNELQQTHEASTKEYESQTTAKYERLKTEFDSAQMERNEMQTRHQTLSNEYEVAKSDLEQAIHDKVSAEQKVSDLEAAHKESFAKYKEKAKHVVNKHKSNAEKQVNGIKEELAQMTAKKEELQNELAVLTESRGEFETSVSDLNGKLRSNQEDLDKLTKQVMALQERNNALEREVQTHETLSNKREETLNKISASLAECSLFKSNDAMGIVEGVSQLAQNYEDISIKHSATESSATDVELKLKEREDKMKRLAVTVRKLQSVRKQLQSSLESTKSKLNETVTKSEGYHGALQTMNTEIQRSLDKWKAFMKSKNETEIESEIESEKEKEKEIETETEAMYLKRCLSDVRSLSMYFIQSLDMYREAHEERTSATAQMEEALSEAKTRVEALQTELEEARKRMESTDHSQIAKNAQIESLTQELNHSIACIAENWHHRITKIDFVDLSVSTRLMLEDCIWCLIRWRHKDKNEKKKYNDEYFWSSQATFLRKLNVKENEIYLPDFFENKLENQITKSLESKWKAIQRRTDRQIQELKRQKSEQEEGKKAANEAFKQYKAKAKVILQKQKEELAETQKDIKELKALREEVSTLKQQLSSISDHNWAQKYGEMETQVSKQKSELQNRKLQVAEIENKLLLKERELSICGEAFDKEKEALRLEFETEKANAKNKFNAKLDDYRQRAREMLHEKDKQLSIARNRLKNVTQLTPTSVSAASIYEKYEEESIHYDKETQTEYCQYDHDDDEEYDDDDAEYNNNNNNNNENVNNVIITSTDDLVAALQPPMNAITDIKKRENMNSNDKDMMSASNIAEMARMQTQRDHKVREFEERVRRLQQLLNTSQQEHKRKDGELEYLKRKFEQIEQAQDVKKSADNSEYLKNALLQYFDGKININQLVSVVAVGLRFNSEEQKKAKNCKLIHQQTGYAIGGYVKSWWS